MTRFTAQHISYEQTKAFSSIATDYVANAPALQPFFKYAPDLEGIKNAMLDRQQFPTDRAALVAQLKAQYEAVEPNEKVQANLQKLLLDNTFTITTAHQPNIFTGHLYFIYKILHTIKVSEELNTSLPGNHFVPVYYMGSEDADLEELGEVNINGKKYTWNTNQGGAVGRMKVDQAFLDLIAAIEGQLLVEPFGNEIIALLKKNYSLNKTIEAATFELVHAFFADYGLVVLLPDNAGLKKIFAPVIERELKEQFSSKAVAETVAVFPHSYKVQAAGREVNLFYLRDSSRERIETLNGHWTVVNSTEKFTEETIQLELKKFPERFSPNVILRPVYQEMVLPNIIFIGGGGELAYWLELKNVFAEAAVPYPVLLLRNSFEVISAKLIGKITALKLQPVDFFQSTTHIIEQLVKKYSNLKLQLGEEKKALSLLYGKINGSASAVDASLEKHVLSLFTQAEKKISQLEKKMLKAEKKKFEAQQRQVEKIKARLFPGENLQERVDNIIPYYATYGRAFIHELYQHSLGLEQQFCILTEKSIQAK